MQEFAEAGEHNGLPTLHEERYLIDMLWEAGPCSFDGMGGPRAMTWADLHAYAVLTGAITEPWEARWLQKASAAYLEELERGKRPLTIAPVDRERN